MKARKGFDLLLKHGYQPFKGLGKNEDGRIEPVIQKHRPHRAGLGFLRRKLTKEDCFCQRGTLRTIYYFLSILFNKCLILSMSLINSKSIKFQVSLSIWMPSVSFLYLLIL